MVIGSQEPEGAGLFGFASCPGVMCKSLCGQLSPGTLKPGRQSYLSCVYIPLTFIGAIFSAVLVVKQVRKKGRRTGVVGK